MRLFDSHCHLAMEEFAGDLDATLQRAREAGAERVLTVGTSPSDWGRTLEIANEQGLYAALAFSPHDAGLMDGDSFGRLSSLAKDPCVRAIGETGLDYHYFLSAKDRQLSAFERHAALAESTALPLVVHSRDSFEDTLSVLGGVRTPVVIHCFTYGPAEAEAFLDAGFFISFSGIATFRGAGAIRDAARLVPAGRMLVETDAPYLSPVPFRGRRCEPAFVKNTVEFLAETLSLSPSALAEATFSNSDRLFGK